MNKIKEQVYRWWEEKPLFLIMLLAGLVRGIAVIFSKGYGMHDDHFLIIEIAQSWTEGLDVLNWFSKSMEENDSGRNFLYPGLHYFLFLAMEKIHLGDPQLKMYAVRFFHAAFSMITVWYGYKMTLKISTFQNARQVGLILALLWIIPSYAVRNLFEMVAIPLLMYGTYILVTIEERKNKWLMYFIAGFIVGIAFPIRYQIIVFAAGLAMVLFFRKKIIETVLFVIGLVSSIALISGYLEWKVWGFPFGKTIYYFTYNFENAENYLTQEWFFYLLLLVVALAPPISLFLLAGNIKVAKKHWLIFLPTFLFFFAHSYFPNKQERFIFTVIPFIIILGVIGANEFFNNSNFWKTKKKLVSSFWIMFWSLNTVFLILFIFSYTKKSRVEAMYYFHDKEQVNALIFDHTSNERSLFLPRFYMDHQWPDVVDVGPNQNIDELNVQLLLREKSFQPTYALFLDDKLIKERVALWKKNYPQMNLVYTAEPSLLDLIFYNLNHVNANQVIYVYKLNNQ